MKQCFAGIADLIAEQVYFSHVRTADECQPVPTVRQAVAYRASQAALRASMSVTQAQRLAEGQQEGAGRSGRCDGRSLLSLGVQFARLPCSVPPAATQPA